MLQTMAVRLRLCAPDETTRTWRSGLRGASPALRCGFDSRRPHQPDGSVRHCGATLVAEAIQGRCTALDCFAHRTALRAARPLAMTDASMESNRGRCDAAKTRRSRFDSGSMHQQGDSTRVQRCLASNAGRERYPVSPPVHSGQSRAGCTAPSVKRKLARFDPGDRSHYALGRHATLVWRSRMPVSRTGRRGFESRTSHQFPSVAQRT